MDAQKLFFRKSKTKPHRISLKNYVLNLKAPEPPYKSAKNSYFNSYSRKTAIAIVKNMEKQLQYYRWLVHRT